jgi:very-short-patch-repair endonuclease
MKNKCVFCGREASTKGGNTIHQNRCHQNPNRRTPSKKWYASMHKRKGNGQNQYTKHGSDWVLSDEARQKIAEVNRNRKPSKETRLKISESMKLAHKENRAWNIGKSRWNNKPSYPEHFFMKAIENEFSDKDFEREYSVGRYSCDFAWIEKKKCIEIDGDQHYRFEEYRQRDQRKDQLLESKGWTVLRIRWKDCFNEPQKWIQIANEFIGT